MGADLQYQDANVCVESCEYILGVFCCHSGLPVCTELKETSVIHRLWSSLMPVTIRYRGKERVQLQQLYVYVPSSLISRPSHREYAKSKVGRPSPLNDVSVQVSRQSQRRPWLKECILGNHSLSQTMSSNFSALWTIGISALGQTLQRRLPAHQGPLPPSVYLGRHWRHSHEKMNHAFPPVFA